VWRCEEHHTQKERKTREMGPVASYLVLVLIGLCLCRPMGSIHLRTLRRQLLTVTHDNTTCTWTRHQQIVPYRLGWT
jgi:hypothetical protein